jgi:hypothetical protein
MNAELRTQIETDLVELRRQMVRIPPHPLREQALLELATLESTISQLARLTAVPLPACASCGGVGTRIQDDGTGSGDGEVFICDSCWGTGVQMTRNPPLMAGQKTAGWKLHRCPDDHNCRATIGGGCASGWCGHFGVQAECLWPNIVRK